MRAPATGLDPRRGRAPYSLAVCSYHCIIDPTRAPPVQIEIETTIIIITTTTPDGTHNLPRAPDTCQLPPALRRHPAQAPFVPDQSPPRKTTATESFDTPATIF
ncbi:hypothetical protein V493_06533 [Pseudogymnoascus sp. VKM F-4281 (FW-2241)]|nr:hypothetical protein V493_06533 [Pseudogymnoascus sp. VKM F-4281 (FW-2241)]